MSFNSFIKQALVKCLITASSEQHLFDNVSAQWERLKQWQQLDTEGKQDYSINLAACSIELLSRLRTLNNEDIVAQCIDLHHRKNRGYAGRSADPWANFRLCEQFGISAVDGCLTRLSDKYARLMNLKSDRTLDRVNEPITDTLQDLINYSIILCCLLDEK